MRPSWAIFGNRWRVVFACSSKASPVTLGSPHVGRERPQAASSPSRDGCAHVPKPLSDFVVEQAYRSPSPRIDLNLEFPNVVNVAGWCRQMGAGS